MLKFKDFFLTEDRVQFVKDNMRAKVEDVLSKSPSLQISPDTVFRVLEGADPTPKKTYFQWLVKIFLANPQLVIEDNNQIRDDLATFERVKSRMPGDQRDINRFKDHYELRRAIEPFEESKSNKEIKKEEVAKFKQDVKVIYDGSEGIIAIPTTQQAACFLGRGTKWCTAASKNNMYKAYTIEGPLYVMLHKDGRKWQLHAASGQIMDEKDTPIRPAILRASPLFQRLKPLVAHEFAKKASSAFKWAEVIGGRFPEGEKAILNDTGNKTWAYRYANEIIKGQWKEAEHLFASDHILAYQYAVHVLHKRFPEGEPAILDSVDRAIQYAAQIIKRPWPELEAKLTRAPSFVKAFYEKAIAKYR